MFQQAPIPDLPTYQNRVDHSPKSLRSSIAINDLTSLRSFLSDKLDESNISHGAPLHLAIYLDSVEAVNILLQAGADPLKEPEFLDLPYLTTPMGLAARLSNRTILQKIWQHINPDISTYDVEGFDGCLVEAAQYGDIAILGDVLRWSQSNWSPESRSRALSAAAENWHVENMQFLLSEIPFEEEVLNVALAHVTVNKPCFEHRDQTEAEIAARSQSIKVLMAAGADSSKPGPSWLCMGEPLLIWTALCRQLHNCLKALLDNGVDPNITNSQGQTALCYLGARVKRDTIFRRRIEDNEPTEDVFHTLLASNASVLHQDINGNTPLHFAAYGLPLKVLQLLLSSVPVESQRNALKMRNYNGETALHFASAGGQIGNITYLLSRNVGLDINEIASMGWTPLLRALVPTMPSLARTRKIEAAQLLLAQGANPSTSTQDGWTPLHCLAMNPSNGNAERIDRISQLIETLLSGGICINSRASFAFDNPLNHPVRKHRVQDGIDYGCQESQYTESPIELGKVLRSDLTPLHIAAEFEALDVIVALLRHGADPAAEDSDGNSPARLAGNSNKYSSSSEARGIVITMLIEAGGSY
ncbi:ankyrin repeat-containing domain protein [Fusarium tricinctum]|uniref:Ankyrin repeat-containing domain protein n=1 Tax=Fusarium tricinctum TaxID=61284 RepID=A0A8K0W7F5_9HYPO|nr:ankyrin repeat-containing domain protein [Fusarium tricinctum]